MILSTVSFLIDLLLLVFNAYSAFASLFENTLFMQTFSVVLLSGLASIPLLPFSWYETMVIEEKYGFNKMTARTFVSDQIKNFVTGLIIMTAIGYGLTLLGSLEGRDIALFAVFAILGVAVFSFFFPFFAKLFNKFKPLEDGELKDKLTFLLNKNGYKVRGIKVMDASRRTTKANAYFTGFGKMKTIVLYDTLLESMDTDEICAVFAHEMGHGLHKDIPKRQIMTLFRIALLILLACGTILVPEIFTQFGFPEINYGFLLILITSVEFAFLSPLLSLPQYYFSRRAEYRADAHAVKEGYGSSLVSGLKKLARRDFADLSPSPLLVKLAYTHPPLSQRISAIEKLIAEKIPETGT